MTYVGMSAKVEIAFVENPYSSTLVWTDVTSRVSKLKTTTGRNYETGKNESSSVNVELRNNDGALNPMNTASPYYPYVLPFRPIRITASTVTKTTTTTTTGPSYPIWYGYVSSWPQSVKDQASQYEMVNVVGVDAFKAVLGFVPGDPYDVKVRKDYGVFAGAGLASTLWNFAPFDEAASPFTAENTASTPNWVTFGTVTKFAPSACRTGLTFAGAGAVQAQYPLANSGQGELFFNIASVPTVGLGVGMITGTNLLSNGGYQDGTGAFAGLLGAGGAANAFFLWQPPQNLMNSDDDASFETSVAGWTAAGQASVARTTAQAIDGVASLRATLTSAPSAANTGAFSNAYIPVTATHTYTVAAYIASVTTVNAVMVTPVVYLYDSTKTLLSAVVQNNVHTGNGATKAFGQVTNTITPAATNTSTAFIRIGFQTGNISSSWATGNTFTLDAVTIVDLGTSPGFTPSGMSYTAPSAGLPPVVLVALMTSATSPLTIDTFILPVPTLNTWHHLAWASGGAVGTAGRLVAIDGVATTVTPTAVTYPNTTGAYIAVGGYPSAAPTYGFNGKIAAVYTMGPTTAGINNVSTAYAAQHYIYGTTATGAARTHDFPAEITSARVTDVMTAIGFPTAMISLETGLTTMSASGNVSGVTATALLVAAAEAELGNVFVDRNGVVTFHNRNHRNSPANTATFGGDGNIPYEGNLVIGFDDTYIFNDVQVTQAATSPAYVFEAQDVTSQNVYGVRTQQATTQVTARSDVQGMANTLLGRYKDPRPRLATLSIELRSKPQYVGQVFGLHIGDLITINHKPPGGTMFSLQCFIDGVSHTVDEQQWLVTFNTTPFYPNTTY